MNFAINVSIIFLSVLSSSISQSYGRNSRLDEASLSFSLDFLRAMNATELKNTIFSPISLQTAFSALISGSSGKTQSELYWGLRLNYGGLKKISQVNRAFQTVISEMPRESVQIANRFLVNERTRVLPAFGNGLKRFYNSTVESVKLSDASLVGKINSWVTKKTEGMIKKIITEPFEESTMLVLLNVVAFKSRWYTQFQKGATRKDTFYNGGKKNKANKNVSFMKTISSFPFKSMRHFDILEMPYEGDFSLLVILPNEGVQLKKVVDSLKFQSISKELSEGLEYRKVDLSFPKFKFSSDFRSLKTQFGAMKIQQIFTSEADLSGIDGKTKNLYISEVLHKAFIEVDEEGTKAAAVTAIIGAGSSGPDFSKPVVVNVNRPFLFMIRQMSTGVVLFMGTVNEL